MSSTLQTGTYLYNTKYGLFLYIVVLFVTTYFFEFQNQRIQNNYNSLFGVSTLIQWKFTLVKVY